MESGGEVPQSCGIWKLVSSMVLMQCVLIGKAPGHLQFRYEIFLFGDVVESVL